MSAEVTRITRISSPAYKIYASWGPRKEEPAEIAARFLACVDRLKDVHPDFDNWTLSVNRKPKKLNNLRDNLAQAVAANVSRGDDGYPELIFGYPFFAINSEKISSRSLSIHARTGAWDSSGFCNSASIKTEYGVTPDPSIIAYSVFKAALLALVESFDATYCSAYPSQLLNLCDTSRNFRPAWMTYLSPRFAPLIAPPPSAIVERTPQGALLMSATEETFSVDNPAHLAAANDILAALAPFEALPWPPDAAPA